jgi:two-component system chemotaxis response regulator CheY
MSNDPSQYDINLDKLRREKRERLGNVRVLLADRDVRTATLVNRILFSFGFRHIDMVTSGEEVLDVLRRRPYDLIITEYNMTPTDGIALVREIRNARDDNRIRRDIPIIMLTAYAERDHVEAARDAGISEFIVKPFTAKTISNRIIQVIDNPRSFIDVPDYVGPCRRRRDGPPAGIEERRGRSSTPSLPPNDELQKHIAPAAELITEGVIETAQLELMKAEGEFVEWAKDDILLLEAAYAEMDKHPGSAGAHKALLEAAYAIKSQAGIFGYDLGTGIASMLVQYLTAHPDIREERLTVVRKHIDAIVVIFTEKIKDTRRDIGQDLINSLRALAKKLG